jgi:triphosphatase
MSSADREIELKFLCEPADIAAILAAAPQGDTQTKDLVSTYFDTPQGDLRAAHISLRIRENGTGRVQTLKRGEGFAREEYEAPLEAHQLDLSMRALKQALPPARRRSLAPTFTVRVARTQRTFHQGEAQIELALDQGEIAHGDRIRAICELELELKAGEPTALFDLARRLARTAPLYLSFDGKASQGQGLGDGTDRNPRRHDKAPLQAGGATGQAFQTIVRNSLAQIAANGVVLREADSSEGVHQLRVAVRRLRSAMSTFGPLIEGHQTESLDAELAWLAATGDDARDLDVFAADNASLAPDELADLSALNKLVAAAQARAHAKVRGALASSRFRDLVLEAAAWVETGEWLTAGGKIGRRRKAPAAAFAAEALDRRWKTLQKRAGDILAMEDADRHRLRIQAKKLRYAAEAFAPLFPKSSAPGFIRRVKTLQTELGGLNDAAVAESLVERLAPKDAALALAQRLIQARLDQKPLRLKAAVKALKKLRDEEPFWRG